MLLSVKRRAAALRDRFKAMQFFDLLDFISSNALLPIGALLTCLFVRWRLPAEFSDRETPTENMLTAYHPGNASLRLPGRDRYGAGGCAARKVRLKVDDQIKSLIRLNIALQKVLHAA